MVMEFGNDLMSALRQRIGRIDQPGQAAHPDWAGMHACYRAAYAARRALLLGLETQARRCGSFEPAAAQILLATCTSSTPVNPTGLGDSKHPGSNAVINPGTQPAGDRGL